MVKTHGHFDRVVVGKYTWTENENLWSVGFNKKWQGCFFSKPSVAVLEFQFGKTVSNENGIIKVISLDIK